MVFRNDSPPNLQLNVNSSSVGGDGGVCFPAEAAARVVRSRPRVSARAFVLEGSAPQSLEWHVFLDVREDPPHGFRSFFVLFSSVAWALAPVGATFLMRRCSLGF